MKRKRAIRIELSLVLVYLAVALMPMQALAAGTEPLGYLVINLEKQQLFEYGKDGVLIMSAPISSGRSGMETPTGNFSANRKAPRTYNQKWDMWLLNWISLDAEGSFGICALEGQRYLDKLGKPASNGYLLIEREYARDLFERVQEGLPVIILSGFGATDD